MGTTVRDPQVDSAKGRLGGLHRHPGAVDPQEIEQARRALALAKTEAIITRAIAAAPPLDPDTLARIRSLIPPVPVPTDGPGA